MHPRRLNQLTAQVIAPMVVWTDQPDCMALLFTTYLRATMAAGIEESSDLAVMVAKHHNGRLAYGHSHIVARLGNLAFQARLQPISFEDCPQVEFVYRRIEV